MAAARRARGGGAGDTLRTDGPSRGNRARGGLSGFGQRRLRDRPDPARERRILLRLNAVRDRPPKGLVSLAVRGPDAASNFSLTFNRLNHQFSRKARRI